MSAATGPTREAAYPHLSEAQLSRVDALQAARTVLVARSPLASSAADPDDLIRLARFVETGSDQ